MKISHNEETGKLNCFSGSLCFSLFLSVSLCFSLFLSVSLCFNVRWCTSPYFKCIGPNKFKDFEDKTTICQYWFMIMKHGINPYTNQGASSSSRTFNCLIIVSVHVSQVSSFPVLKLTLTISSSVSLCFTV